MSTRSEPELVALRKLAEELARGRKERVTSAHLLAAIAARPSAASDLLAERKLTEEALLRAARASSEDMDDPLRRAVQRAREIASRMGAREPNAVHLLVALVSERRSAAHRALDQCGVDLNRLRSSAMNVGLGLLGRRRATRKENATPEPRTIRDPLGALTSLASKNSAQAQATAKRPPPGVAIPLFPPATSERKSTATVVRDPSLPSEPPRTSREPVEIAPPRAQLKKRSKSALDDDRFVLEPHKFPTLASLGRNLTLAAARGEMDPVVGRHIEVEQALDVLAKRQGNNPCLVGVAGVGKTSVVHGIAQRIAASEHVLSLDDRIIVEIPVSELVAGTGVRGALALRVGALRKEVAASNGRIVLFFDEIHQLFAGEAAEEISGELKLAMANGELPSIGATTREDYAKVIETDPALARRFTLVEVDEPSREDAYLVLEAVAERLALYHHVRYETDALALGVGWSVRYLPGRALPDKAVSIADLAGARVRRRGGSAVTAEAIAEVVAELADMPVERLLETDADRFLRLEEILGERVVGHVGEITKIARILRRNAAGLGSRRPIGTFLLLGPTGVGKTETAKAIAEVLFHTENAMTRIDLSEYGEPHSVARLIGAPPGYVGHEAGGHLTEAIRRRPYQVVLLDEIEKAHPEVLETFLGVFDEGRLTDGRGRTVDFTNTVIVMTSNIGADEAGSASKRRVGFGSGNPGDAPDLERRLNAAARSALSPELYNRIDEVLAFTPLGRAEVREIAKRLLIGVGRTLFEHRGIRLEVDDSVVDALLDAGGFDPTLGARPMKRTLARLVEAPLAERILRGELSAGDVALLGVVDGELSIDVLDGAERMATPAAE